jgi:hypothetical protein
MAMRKSNAARGRNAGPIRYFRADVIAHLLFVGAGGVLILLGSAAANGGPLRTVLQAAGEPCLPSLPAPRWMLA